MLPAHQLRQARNGTCTLCGHVPAVMSANLGVCGECVGAHRDETLRIAQDLHADTRRAFDLPSSPPRTPGGVRCVLCARECRIGEGERGYCGLRTVHAGRLVHLAGTPQRGILHWYRDPLPTNCVADWICTGSRQLGCHNLAVFYASCTLNCLFCQNWSFREVSAADAHGVSAEQLAEVSNARIGNRHLLSHDY